MGSVQSFSECKQCKGMLVENYNYRTGEEYLFCGRCGYNAKSLLIRDENNTPVRTEDGKFQYKKEILSGEGIMQVVYSDGFAANYRISKELFSTKDALAFFEEMRTEHSEQFDKDKSYITSWDDEKKEVTAIYGKVPPLYSELTTDAEDGGDKE